MKKIGMIAAMDGELKTYLGMINAKKINGGAYEVYSANSHGKELFIVKSGIGEIAAAGATQYLITAFNVDVVFNFGICGKINKDIDMLDTIIVSSVVHYRFDLSGIDDVAPAVYKGNSPFMPLDDGLIGLMKNLDGGLKEGICASGDIFLYKKEDIEDLREKFNADVCDMELAGILITCDTNNIPCLALKSVSDDGDGDTYKENKKIAAEKHIALIDKFVGAY